MTSISPGAQAQLRRLLDISEEACQAVVRERLLKSLAFPGMYGRFEAVETAHYETFQWIFEGPSETGQHGGEICQSTRESFVHWLSFGHGIFHVCGKLGSGKSTLMKFLCNHDRTKTELEQWAG
jgi:polynucleotide 5'-kinase involved in rRNA processing